MDGAGARLFKVCKCLFEILLSRFDRSGLGTRFFQPGTQSKLQLTGSFFCKSDGDNVVHGRPAFGQDADDPVYQFRGLSSPGRRLDDQGVIEITADLIACLLVNERHYAIPLSRMSWASGAGFFRPARNSS